MPFGETLKQRAGPLPVWGWAALFVLVLIAYFVYRNKKAAAAAQTAQANSQGLDSSNLGNVPISNLTTDAQPMPFQMGDTFVNVDNTQTADPVINPPTAPVSKPPVAVPNPPSKPLPPAPKPAAPKQPAQQTTTVCAWPSWCGSLWGIAQHFYGDGAQWTKIYTANKGIIGNNPNLIHPGLKLVIPG